jgi:pimeloyl-ACP methyl ester carboxylesterase
VADAGHLVPMEKPDEFNKLALEFLATHHEK